MAEKTIEELQADLEALKKENLEREIAAEKAKQEEAERLQAQAAEEKQREELKAEVKAELIKEMGDTSKVEDNKPVTNVAKPADTKETRLKYEATTLNNIPGNKNTLAVFNEDAELLGVKVAHETGKEIKGRGYEDIILEMETKRALGWGKK